MMNKITVITPTYNSSKYIKNSIESIINQEKVEIENIIIDGGSTDNTIEILKEYNVKYISEPDDGIYDAMNKGIKIASGNIIAILNSDDVYSDNNVLEKVNTAFSETDCDIVYGNINIVGEDGNTIRYWRPGGFNKKSFFKGWHPPHPSFFVKREVYKKYGLFRTDLSMAADFEFMLRVMEKERLKVFYIDEVLVNMGFGGATTGSIKNILKGNIQCIKAFKINGFKPPALYSIIRLLPKVKQFFIK